MDELQKLYNAVSAQFDIGDFDTFKSKMSTIEQRRSFYDKVGSNGFDLGDYNAYEARLGKPTEVSPQGSVATSQTSVEPTQNIDQSQSLPTQQNGDLSNQSLDTATPEVQEQSQVQIPEGFRDAGGGNLIPIVNRQGTWREPFEGDFSYDTQGYEVYTPTPKTVADAGGWDNLVKFFREQQPNTLLAPPFDPNSPESEQSIGELSGQYINEDVAKPINLDALVKERELSKKPFDQWSKDDQMDFYLSRIVQMNRESGNFPKEDDRNSIIERQATERRNEDRGITGTFADFVGTALRGFGRGSTRLLADVLDVPEFVYDALSNITNEPTFKEKYGNEFLGQVSDYLRGAVSRDELYNSIRFGDEGVTDSFLKGSIEDGVNKLVGSTTESLPIMLSLSAGNASSLTSTLSMGAGQYNQLQQENPDMDLSTKMINATLNMYAEMIPEKIGADAVFKPFYDLYKKSGREVAENALASYMRKLGGRFGVLTPSATEAITEGATNTMSNLIAKYSGEDPNRKLNDGLNDALLIGGTSGGVIAAPAQVANSIADKKVRGQVQSLAKENIDIEISLNDKELPEDIRERLIDRYTKNTETINGYVEQQIADKGRLNSKQKEIVDQLEASKARVNALIGDENVPESVQTNAQAEVDSINDQIEEIITQENEKTGSEQVESVATQESSEVPVESTEVQPVGETVEQSQELVEETPTQNEEEIAQETQTQEGLTPKENNNKSLSEDEYFTVPTSSTDYDGYIVIDKDTYDKWKEIDDNEKELINQAKRGERLLGREQTAKKIKGIAMSSAAEKRKVLGIDNSDEVSRIDVSKVQVNDEYTSGDKTYKVTGFAFGQPMVSENGGTPKKLNTFNNESDIRKGLLNQKKAKRDDLIEKSKVNHYGRGVTREEAWKMAVNEYGKQNEEVVTETVEPVAETGPQNQNVDVKPDEIDMSLVPPRPEPQEVQTTARTQMEPRSSFANTDEYQRSLAEQSNNPDEIAYEYARTEPREADPIEQGIMDYMGSGRINAKDFAEYGDSNWLEDMDAKTRRRWINSDNTESLSLDQMAQELSSNLNMEVTPEDIIGVIMDFGGRADFDASRKTEGQKALEQKYKELTGKNLTPYVARRTADMMDRRAAELTDEQRAAVDENLQDLGITYQDILDYEEFNRQIAESGPGGLQQPQVNQGTVSQSRAQDSGAQEGQTGQTGQVGEAPLPKSLLKGISDRLKLTGLAKSVKFMSSEEIKSDLPSRRGVQFQTDSSELSKIESDAKGNGSWMKAPNGKKSNLNEKQWVLVRTKAFKDWFGDWENNPENSSKVIDANGEPMVVYHGTNGNFTVFDPSKIGINANAEGPGFYFTNDKNTAQGYQNTNKDNPNLFEVFLNIKNPINLNESNFKKQEIKRIIKAVINNETAFDPEGIPDFRDSFMSNFVDTYSTTESKAIDEVADMLVEDDTKIDFIAGLGNAVGSQSLVLKSVKEALGYDATIADGYGGRGEGGGSIFVAWESNQIKSATDNTGTFDGTNPDIRFQGQNSGNVVNGYVDSEGNIVINSDTAGLDTPIHEFGHIWESVVEKENPELHARGMELIQSPEGKPYVDHVRQTQPELKGRGLYKEALAQAIGDSGARLIEGQRRSAIKEWLDAAWEYIATRTGISGMTPSQISNLTLREYTDAVAVDLLSGKRIEPRTQSNEAQTENTVQTNERKKVPSKKEQKVADSSKVEAKRRESALSGTPSKIREGIKVPSDIPGSRGSAIAGDAFNDAADVVARAIDNGSSLDEAISQGIDNMKKSYWYRTLPKDSKKQAEQSFRDAVNGANEMVYAEQNPSAKNSRSQKLREKYGFGDRIIPETQGSNEVLAEARADIREGRVFPIDVVNKGLAGKQLTAKEQAIIVEYMNQLEAEVALQGDRIENDNTMTPEAFNEVDKMREEALNKLSAAIYALERTGTEIARALASRKWIVNRDVSLPSMISMKRKANGNVPLTTEQLESVRREFDAIMKDKARLDKRMAEIEAELASAKADIVMMAEAKKAELEYRKAKDKAGSKKEALTDIQARRAEAKQALKDAVGKITNLGFAYNPKQQAQHDADFLSALGTLLKTYFDEALLRSGKVNYNAIINNITRDLQDAHPNITKEQVAQMIDALDTDTRPTLQYLRAEVASLKEEIKTHNLESEKQSIRRRIDNINEKIKAKDYKTVPSGLEKYDAEYRQLKKQLDDRIYEFKVEMERDKLRRRGLLHKAFSYSSEIFALPRALMATGDLSAPLRQGIVAMVGNPRTGIKAFKEMHKMALNEAYYEAYHEAVRDSEMYDLATRSGLSLSGVGNNVWTTLREEQWTSRLINKIPVLKNVAAFSERGFAGFLNKMRFDLFNQGAELLINEGKSFQTHPDQFKAVATYVNAVTGRGPVPSRWEGMFGDLSTALFAPRLITSRLYLLLGGPIVSAVRSGNWNIAKSYAKDMAGFISFGIGTMFLASMLEGVSIEGDDEDEPLFTQGAADTWTKGDFLNIRVGDTRYDIWGGFAQYIRLFARIITGQTTSSSGKVKIAADAKNIGDTELGWILRFGQSKLSPTAAFAVGFLSHRNYMGDPFNPVNELQNMAWPLVFQETAESMFGGEDFRPEALATIFLPSAYGVGVQTWSSNSFLKNGTDNKIIDVLTKKKLNTMSKRQQDVTVIEPSTGESRKVTDEEFAQYKKVWDDYVKNELNKNIDKIEKMSESKAEKEFNNIKRAATVLAKKSITGVSSDDTRIQFDKKTYDLDGDVLKRRLRYMDEYREANGNRYNTQYPKELKRENPSITPEEIKISIEKQMDKDARSYSREKILDDYVKGRIKLTEN